MRRLDAQIGDAQIGDAKGRDAKDRDAKDRDAKDRDAKDRDAKDRSRRERGEREREREGGPHAVQLPQGGRSQKPLLSPWRGRGRHSFLFWGNRAA